MSMWTDMMAAETAMREATTLIEEQRAAIDDLHGALAGLVFFAKPHFSDELQMDMLIHCNEVLAKHAPAQSQEDADPTPYCCVCGAMTAGQCDCGPTDPMN